MRRTGPPAQRRLHTASATGNWLSSALRHTGRGQFSGESTTKTFPSSLAFGLAAALAATAPVLASTVSSTNFSATSTSSTLDQSCKMMDYGSAKLEGECNKVTDDGVDSGNATTLSLDTYVTCNEGNELAWGSGGLTSATGLDVTLSSTGSQYVLTGTCSSGGSASELNLRARISNNTATGTFQYTAPSN